MKKNEIPQKTRIIIDELWECWDDDEFVYSAGLGYRLTSKGEWITNRIVKKGTISFNNRQLHHIDHDRSNNEYWNLVPLTFDEHLNIIEGTAGLKQKLEKVEFRNTCKAIFANVMDKQEAIIQIMQSEGRTNEIPCEKELDLFYRKHLWINEIEAYENKKVQLPETFDSCPY